MRSQVDHQSTHSVEEWCQLGHLHHSSCLSLELLLLLVSLTASWNQYHIYFFQDRSSYLVLGAENPPPKECFIGRLADLGRHCVPFCGFPTSWISHSLPPNQKILMLFPIFWVISLNLCRQVPKTSCSCSSYWKYRRSNTCLTHCRHTCSTSCHSYLHYGGSL